MTAVMTVRYKRTKELLDETLEMYDKYEAITGEAPKKFIMDLDRNNLIVDFIRKNIKLNMRGEVVTELWGIPVECTEWRWMYYPLKDRAKYKKYTEALFIQ